MLIGLLHFIDLVLGIALFVIFAYVIVSWLITFGIVNTSNQFVAIIVRALYGLIDPLLAPIRRFMPHLGGIDLSPLILLLVIYFIRLVILYPAVASLS